ncbi:MAG: murein L,D-transpeptidase [Flavisolibacter sp.]
MAIKLVFFPSLLSLFFLSCNDSHHSDVTQKEIVEKPDQINARAEDVIQGTLKDILSNRKELADSLKIKNPEAVQYLYQQNSFQPLWSAKGLFTPIGDSLFSFIAASRRSGLFPEDYYLTQLTSIKTQLISDTSSREKKLDASLWAYSDMLLSSAFVQIVKDLKIGRLLPDSVVSKDSTLNGTFFQSQLQMFRRVGSDSFAQQLEPQIIDYQKLKAALRNFLDSAHIKPYTLINTSDTTQILSLLYQRLKEEDSTLQAKQVPDSAELSLAIKKFEVSKGMKADGKVSAALITKLNDNDKEKFIRVAMNMDRYKDLPAMPDQYLWVNLPSYYLQLRDSDTVVLRSRIVVGKPLTRTPIITSAISDMITYPKWTIPESIIKKEVLPGLKKDSSYTIRRGYSIIDDNGNEIDPLSIKWTKYKDYIPYKVVQGSGDDNALGILKFNFPNKYSVYLHDTNQRYLFSKTNRALSHGCVRVQAWEELAKYILRNDSVYSVNAVRVDSLENWLQTKQKRYIPVHKPIPLFIRYFTCDVKEGRLTFYEDIYGEDKRIREKVFSDK